MKEKFLAGDAFYGLKSNTIAYRYDSEQNHIECNYPDRWVFCCLVSNITDKGFDVAFTFLGCVHLQHKISYDQIGFVELEGGEVV